MAWNSQIADNEYTTLEQRKKQNASRKEFAPDYKVPPTTAEPVYEKVTVSASAPAISGGGSSGYDSYSSLLREMKNAQEAEYARQRAEYERQQALLKQQQLNLKNQRNAELNTAYDNSKTNLDTAKNASMKDSYIAYMQGLKRMPQVSAVSGNGGYAQSLLNKQQLNYENNRAGIEQNYLDNLRQLEEKKNAGLTAIESDYLNGIMGLETNAQNYLNQLSALDKDADSYATQMAGLIKSNIPETTAAKTTSNVFGGKYKVGGKTLSRDEYLAYLAGYGMDAEEAAAYMAKNKIPY